MSKTIDAILDPEFLEKLKHAWCEYVTDSWNKRNSRSPDYNQDRSPFTRAGLIELARIARDGDDGFKKDEQAQSHLLKAHLQKGLIAKSGTQNEGHW